MNEIELLKSIYKNINKEKILNENPDLTMVEIDEFFKKVKSNFFQEDKNELQLNSNLLLYTDGAARGNPGPASVGCVLKNSKGENLKEFCKVIGTATNNVAEYQALVYGLDLALEFKPDILDIYSDSELLVKQMTGVYKTKNTKIKELKEIAEIKLQEINKYTFTAIRRELNTEADKLANKALDESSPGMN